MEIVSFKDKKRILEVLKKGGLVVFPTETCYGIGADATNQKSVDKVLKYKKRPEGKAISIACADFEIASKYVEVNETAKNIYTKFLPGPVTVISKSKNIVAKGLEAENGTLGIRIPAYTNLLEVLKEFGKPITSTSANTAGKKTPYKIEDIFENISEKQKQMIDLIIDVGELPHNPPSTVIDTTTEDLTIYRKGDIQIGKSDLGEWRSKSLEETMNIGSLIITKIVNRSLGKKPIVILLDGEMGAGKTHLTKGFAKKLGIKHMIKSPTYNYVDEYSLGAAVGSNYDKTNGWKLKLGGWLYHIDAWRIKTKEDLEILQFDRYLKAGNIIVIEWPSIVKTLAPDLLNNANQFLVQITPISESERSFSLHQLD